MGTNCALSLANLLARLHEVQRAIVVTPIVHVPVPFPVRVRVRDTLALKFSRKVQVGKDQEKEQSEKDSHSTNRGGKKPNQQSGTYTMKQS